MVVAASPSKLVPGTLFADRFRVVREVGAGGMGVVYEVEQVSLGRRRALKTLHPRVLVRSTPEATRKLRERFLAEARTSASITSPYVVAFDDCGIDTATEQPWALMELLQGQPLDALVEARGVLGAAEAWTLLRQAGEGVGAAHRAGVVHCDLKPENLFVTRDGTVKVLDFGISRIVDAYRTHALGTTPCGSPRWMAPEQTERNRPIRPATDVWSLGLIAFHLLTAKHYLPGANRSDVPLLALLLQIRAVEPVPASARARELGVVSELPTGFDAWFARCVVADPARRYADATTATEALRDVLAPRAREGYADTEPTLPDTAPSLGGTVVLPDGVAELQAALAALARAEHDLDVDRCILFGERVLTLDPTNADVAARTARVYRVRGWTCEQRGDRAGAERDFRRATELSARASSG
jgi:serine/threonine-protein kinase